MPDLNSDDEDSEVDNAVVGCLGFLPLAGQESPVKTAPPDSEKTPSKTDIAAASPGAVGTDPESQSEFRKERAAAEQLREKEKLDIGHMQRQYMRMRKLQKKNMLVFNSFANQTSRPKNEMRSKAINHLFIDLPSIEKEKKGERHARYPFLKPIASVNHRSPDVKYTEDGSYSANQEISGTIKNVLKTDETTNVSMQSVESESLDVELLGKCNVKSRPNSQNRTSNDTKKDAKSTVTGKNLCSSTFIVDKNALYPANFKPFPQRTQMPKSKLFMSNHLANSSNKGKQVKNSNNLSNMPVR